MGREGGGRGGGGGGGNHVKAAEQWWQVSGKTKRWSSRPPVGLDADSSSLVAKGALEAPAWLLQQHSHLADVPHTRQQILHGRGLCCPHTCPRHLGQLLHPTTSAQNWACQTHMLIWGGGGVIRRSNGLRLLRVLTNQETVLTLLALLSEKIKEEVRAKRHCFELEALRIATQ